MKLDNAIKFAAALQAAIDRAKAEGRDHLTEADLDTFSAIDDDARADLEHAIEQSEKGN